MISTKLLDVIRTQLNARKCKILTYAQIAMTESQFLAFKGLIFDELGRNGFESELEKLLNEGKHSVHTRNEQE